MEFNYFYNTRGIGLAIAHKLEHFAQEEQEEVKNEAGEVTVQTRTVNYVKVIFGAAKGRTVKSSEEMEITLPSGEKKTIVRTKVETFSRKIARQSAAKALEENPREILVNFSNVEKELNYAILKGMARIASENLMSEEQFANELPDLRLKYFSKNLAKNLIFATMVEQDKSILNRFAVKIEAKICLFDDIETYRDLKRSKEIIIKNLSEMKTKFLESSDTYATVTDDAVITAYANMLPPVEDSLEEEDTLDFEVDFEPVYSGEFAPNEEVSEIETTIPEE